MFRAAGGADAAVVHAAEITHIGHGVEEGCQNKNGADKQGIAQHALCEGKSRAEINHAHKVREEIQIAGE